MSFNCKGLIARRTCKEAFVQPASFLDESARKDVPYARISPASRVKRSMTTGTPAEPAGVGTRGLKREVGDPPLGGFEADEPLGLAKNVCIGDMPVVPLSYCAELDKRCLFVPC
jgi:hypothetical protein